jgi:AcrR family transcriptional regulator
VAVLVHAYIEHYCSVLLKYVLGHYTASETEGTPLNATTRRINAAAMRLFAERGHADLTISDLAAEAGVARGTLYRNVDSMESLFDQVRGDLALELHRSIQQVMDAAEIVDPPRRLATGIRLMARLPHEDAALGRFLVRFGLTDESLRELLTGPPMQDVNTGIKTGRYAMPSGRELSVASLIIGATVGAIWMVIEGHQTWRDAGSGAAELVLRALGISEVEAAGISREPLPDAD